MIGTIRVGHRHEVEFGDTPISVEVLASHQTVQIFVEAVVDTHRARALCDLHVHDPDKRRIGEPVGCRNPHHGGKIKPAAVVWRDGASGLWPATHCVKML